MTVDLRAMNHDQLNELIKRIEQRQLEVANERIAAIRDKIHALLKLEDLTLEEVFLDRRKMPPPVAAKYRNPEDHSQTWSGRGKRPRWFHAALKTGMKEQDLLIQ